MPADVRRERVHDEVDAVLDRLLEQRRRPRAVDDRGDATGAGDVGDASQVEDLHPVGARALAVDEPRRRAQVLLPVLARCADEGVLDAEALEVLRQLQRGAVDAARGAGRGGRRAAASTTLR